MKVEDFEAIERAKDFAMEDKIHAELDTIKTQLAKLKQEMGSKNQKIKDLASVLLD